MCFYGILAGSGSVMGRSWCELQVARERALGVGVAELQQRWGGGWKNWLCGGDGGW
jgi:hypothetical protein